MMNSELTFVDVMVFYPLAPSYRNQSPVTTIKTMENQKKRKYNQRILDCENGSYTPLVFTTNGGMSMKTKQFYRRIGQLLCERSDVRILVRGLSGKWVLVSFEYPSFV